ncbi:hypothetical protein AB0I28_19100 [Phytomonospora sp. NPDC050363]|uniref:hypothetical protein n=1 Tax=Phytomonospora sp. NPDC050363 TaxID=3155642 RepID=UPI0033C60086
MRTLVLVHSPLVGPSAWRPAGESLAARGFGVVIASPLGGLADGPPLHAAFARAVAGETPDGAVLVVHSGAGALVPAIAAAAEGRVTGAVYVDALLPHPGRTWFDTAPSELGAHLRELAEDGLLPPWNEWFPPGAVDGLLPDAGPRADFLAELPRLPLSYFGETAPEHDAPFPGAYLRLSDGYEEQAAAAEASSWPVVREDADHLAVFTRPRVVAGHVAGLVAAIT